MHTMRQATSGVLAVLAGAILLAGLACAGLSVLSGHTVTVGGGKSLLNVHNPVQEAQATRVAQAAADEAAARELERQAKEAARPALALRNTLMALGVGVGVLVLTVGSAFAAVALVNKRATAVYPDNAGLNPVIAFTERSWNGVTIVHDPNRTLGPTTIYQERPYRFLRSTPQRSAGGQTCQVLFPQPGSEPAVVQITGQAQVAQIAAAPAPGSGPDDGQGGRYDFAAAPHGAHAGHRSKLANLLTCACDTGAGKRLASKARATGVYLWLAATHGTADILPRVVSVNLSSRIVLRVQDAAAARVAGCPGAERIAPALPGRLLARLGGTPQELQGYYLPYDRLAEIAKALRGHDEESDYAHLLAIRFMRRLPGARSASAGLDTSPEQSGGESYRKSEVNQPGPPVPAP